MTEYLHEVVKRRENSQYYTDLTVGINRAYYNDLISQMTNAFARMSQNNAWESFLNSQNSEENDA